MPPRGGMRLMNLSVSGLIWIVSQRPDENKGELDRLGGELEKKAESEKKNFELQVISKALEAPTSWLRRGRQSWSR